MEKKEKNKISNPFKDKDEKKVWKSLLSNSKPISPQDFEKKIKELKK